MQIVIEGPDNSGKSTLASKLAYDLHRPIIRSKGKCADGEMLLRYHEYRQHRNAIFDRFSAISEPIYGLALRQRASLCVSDRIVIEHFYATRPLIIACAGRSLEGHVADNVMDTPDYISQLELMHPKIVRWYEEWARTYATLHYSIGDNYLNLLKQVESHLAQTPHHID